MSWPIGSDYAEAVQNPRLCFADPDLKAGTAAVTPLGLPRAITGAFAIVHDFTCPSGRWAVRCFLRDFDDQRRRYEAIGRRLKAAGLPSTVGFEFQPQGIRVGGQWYPVLKMEWIDGQPLNTYVERHLRQPDALRRLAQAWAETMADLGRAGLAHGDLQHGNVLVDAYGRVRLIDYDGMYVPDLAGLGTHETGHRNYQHPGRGDQFGPDMDRFSAWVVSLSLSALAIDPALWQRLDGGDECLLFRHADYEHPGRSRALSALDGGRPELAAIAARLRSLLRLPAGRVPALDDKAGPLQPVQPGRPSGLPDWLQESVPESPPPTPPPRQLPDPAERLLDPEPAGPDRQPDWLYDPPPTAAVPARPVWTGVRVGRERAVILTVAVVVFGLTLWLGGHFPEVVQAGVAAPATAGVYLRRQYRRLTVVAERATAIARVAATAVAADDAEAAVAAARAERGRVVEPLVKIDKAYCQAAAELPAQLGALSGRLKQTRETLATERAGLADREEHAVAVADRDAEAEVRRLTLQRDGLDRSRAAEIDRLTTRARDEHIADHMQRATLRHATVPGIGPRLTMALRQAGIECAADVDWRAGQVPGIGPDRMMSLRVWRADEERRAAATVPVPPRAEVSAIETRYGQQRRALSDQIDSAHARWAAARHVVADDLRRRRAAIDQQQRAAQLRFDREAAGAGQACHQRRRELADRFARERPAVENRRLACDAEIGRLRQALRGCKDLQRSAEQEAAQLRCVTFGRYVARVLGGRRAT